MSTTSGTSPAASGKRLPCAIDATAEARAARKPKRTPVAIAPLYGRRNLDEMMRDDLVNTRAALGLASGLRCIFSVMLEEAEEEHEKLGMSSSDDAGARYGEAINRANDLRAWAAVTAALQERLEAAERSGSESARRVAYAARRGGDHAA